MFSFFKRKEKKQNRYMYLSTDFNKKSIQVTKNDCVAFLREYHRICNINDFKSHILDFQRSSSDYLRMLYSFKKHLDQLLQVYKVEEVCDKLCTRTPSLLKAVNEIIAYIEHSDNPLCLFIRNSEMFEQIVKANPVIQYREFKGHEVDIPDELMQLFLLITYRRVKSLIELRYQIPQEVLTTTKV